MSYARRSSCDEPGPDRSVASNCARAVSVYLPHGRAQVGDCHLKFHETRDNLQPLQGVYTDELVGSVGMISRESERMKI